MQNTLSGIHKQAKEVETREFSSLVVTKYTKLKNVLAFDTFLHSLPTN
jgi:hypothetical protein